MTCSEKLLPLALNAAPTNCWSAILRRPFLKRPPAPPPNRTFDYEAGARPYSTAIELGEESDSGCKVVDDDADGSILLIAIFAVGSAALFRQ